VLFVVTMLGIDRTETLIEARSLGALLPLVLLPSIGWHLLRAAGWYARQNRDPPTGESSGSDWLLMALATSRSRRRQRPRVVLLMGRVSRS
jgi:hypothetical protein